VPPHPVNEDPQTAACRAPPLSRGAWPEDGAGPGADVGRTRRGVPRGEASRCPEGRLRARERVTTAHREFAVREAGKEHTIPS